MPFIDEAIVKLKAGRGGDGCLSFRREKYIPRGGPDGGDGGRGADVMLFCDENTSDLSPYVYDPEWKAPDGQHGMGAQCYGKEGKELVLKVPLGTEVIDTKSGKIVAELLEHGQQVRLLKGGKGGMGNMHFKSSVNRAPRQTTPGKPGQEGVFRLELKSIADVGLVGFPNAGKSSLINLLTNAKSKVGSYPFTTLNPHLGAVKGKGVTSRSAYLGSRDKSLVIADIPGLIEGASQNKGLGHKFLKHIERCKLLLFVVDASGIEGRKPADDFKTLLNELEAYNPALLEKQRLVVANKMDLVELYEKKFSAAGFLYKRKKQEVLELSCVTLEGLQNLKERLEELLRYGK